MIIEENALSKIIIGACISIHQDLGPGLLESVYEEILYYELTASGLVVERQKPIPLNYHGLRFNVSFQADLIVEGKVLIELKSVEKIKNVYKKQLLTYLKLTELKLGLLINFKRCATQRWHHQNR